MKKILLLVVWVVTSISVFADPINLRPVNPPTTPSPGNEPRRAPLVMPTATYENGVVCVTYPFTTVISMSLSNNDGSFYYEQTYYAVTTASISDLSPDSYSLTISIDGIEYEGLFEITDENE